MTGPGHSREAQRLLDQAEIDSRDPMRKYAEDANVIAAAQVHATLALVAAVRDASGHATKVGRSLSDAVGKAVRPAEARRRRS